LNEAERHSVKARHLLGLIGIRPRYDEEVHGDYPQLPLDAAGNVVKLNKEGTGK
jgi:hypothetical protein